MKKNLFTTSSTARGRNTSTTAQVGLAMRPRCYAAIAAVMLLAAFNLQFSTLFAQGTAFTYQGRLMNGTNPANGTFSLSFQLFLGPGAGGVPLLPELNFPSVPVTNGFLKMELDFGAQGTAVLNGQAVWLEIRVNGTALNPRQLLTPAPYAIFSAGAGSVRNPTFLGTTAQPLELTAGDERALRLEPTPSGETLGAPNVIGGSSVNRVASGVLGATIAGGGALNYGAGSRINQVLADFGTIGGGFVNTISGADGTIAGGQANTASGPHAAVGGGSGNVASGLNATVSGGDANTASGYKSAVSGGFQNRGIANWATISGGDYNLASGTASSVGGGSDNISSGAYSTVPGGRFNTATDYAMAAGRRAKAVHTGAFVWADSTDADFSSTVSNQFNIRASGGVRLSDDTPNLSFGSATRQMLNLWGTAYGVGVQNGTMYFRTDAAFPGVGHFAWYRGGTHNDGVLNPGGGTELMRLGEQGSLHLSGPYNELSLGNRDVSGFVQFPVNGERWLLYCRNQEGSGRLYFWSGHDKASLDLAGNLYLQGTVNPASDRNLKANFAAINPSEVLDKITRLSIQSWNYTNDPASRHMGPTAQDFRAAFALGADDKHIATVDADGVALAAIQGLNRKVEEQAEKIKDRDSHIAELERRLSALEKFVCSQTQKGE